QGRDRHRKQHRAVAGKKARLVGSADDDPALVDVERRVWSGSGRNHWAGTAAGLDSLDGLLVDLVRAVRVVPFPTAHRQERSRAESRSGTVAWRCAEAAGAVGEVDRLHTDGRLPHPPLKPEPEVGPPPENAVAGDRE